ncbi:hypothetical protein [Streptomyces sp. NPDC058247]|uniref:hypothetical protein n=1 Tax=Streptomyces sp. NPDC058247 TaxID=3346401 RepID=UPI0036E3B6A9
MFVPEKYGGFLVHVHSSRLLVAEARDAGIHGEGAQMYVDGDLRTADEVAHVVDALRSHSLRRAQRGAIGLPVELCVEITAGVNAVGGQQVGDGVGRCNLP